MDIVFYAIGGAIFVISLAAKAVAVPVKTAMGPSRSWKIVRELGQRYRLIVLPGASASAVIAGPAGVFALAGFSPAGRVRVVHGHLFDSNTPCDDAVVEARAQASRLTAIAREAGVNFTVRPVVFAHGVEVPAGWAAGGVPVTGARGFVSLLRESPRQLSDDGVERLASRLEP